MGQVRKEVRKDDGISGYVYVEDPHLLTLLCTCQSLGHC